MNGHLEVVKVLVGAGADARLRNAVGRNCVGEAEVAGGNGKEGCGDCVVWMLEHCEGFEGGSGPGGGKEEEKEVDGEEAAVVVGEKNNMSNGTQTSTRDDENQTKEGKQQP